MPAASTELHPLSNCANRPNLMHYSPTCWTCAKKQRGKQWEKCECKSVEKSRNFWEGSVEKSWCAPHAPHRLITQRVFIVSLTVYQMNSDDKANGNDNRSPQAGNLENELRWQTAAVNLLSSLSGQNNPSYQRVKRCLSSCPNICPVNRWCLV